MRVFTKNFILNYSIKVHDGRMFRLLYDNILSLNTNFFVFPKKIKKIKVIRSPHVNKTSMEEFKSVSIKFIITSIKIGKKKL